MKTVLVTFLILLSAFLAYQDNRVTGSEAISGLAFIMLYFMFKARFMK